MLRENHYGRLYAMFLLAFNDQKRQDKKSKAKVTNQIQIVNSGSQTHLNGRSFFI